MFRKNGIALVAACAAVACAGLVQAGMAPVSQTSVSAMTSPSVTASTTTAADLTRPMMMDLPTTVPSGQPAEPTTAQAPAATAPASTPSGGSLMALLRGNLFDSNAPAGGLGAALDGSGIVVTGYVEGSWTYSAHIPPGNILTDRAFDTKTESVQFDQVELLVTKQADFTQDLVLGFTVENIYGWDTAYFHSNGLAIYSSGKTASPVGVGVGSTATIHPKAQYDLTQANFVIGLGKVGHGIAFEGGKFDTLLGYEVIDANGNPFFSHSYIFTQEPFTHTGALGIWNISDPNGADALTFTGGMTRGWDQATEDVNGSIDFTGQLAYKKQDTSNNNALIYSLALSGITGNEEPSGVQDGWRTVLDLVGHYTISDQLSLGFNGMYAWENQTSEGGSGGGIGQWYGAAVYLQYLPPNISQFVSVNLRGEWFNDPDGAAPTQYNSALAVSPTTGRAIGLPNTYYEATVGLTITPFATNTKGLAGLHIRPEFRWDYSNHAAFNAATQHDQWTAAVEAYFSF